jgi:predicted phage terminase large subunit-like protein
MERMAKKYEGTRLGRQELHAEMLDDVPGALWQRQNIEQYRVARVPDLVRIIVGVDPAMTSGEDANETGIIVAGKSRDGHVYVLEDLSCRLSPDGWGRRAVSGYRRHRADRIVAEVNNGGDLVERMLRVVDPSVSYRAVRATRGKVTRAEPIVALYEQGRVHHVASFTELEDQMCAFVPDRRDGSPDRVDALVWCLTELLPAYPTIRMGNF